MPLRPWMNTRKTLLLGAVLALLIFFYFSGILLPLQNQIFKLTSPLLRFLYLPGTKLNGWQDSKTKSLELDARNNFLEKQYRDLLTENNTLKNELAQLKTLQSQIQYLNTKKLSSVLTNVISQENVNESTILTLDKGGDDGIQKGLPVVIDKGILIGKIIQADKEVSRVLLLSSASSQTSATFESENATLGIISGDHGLNMKMELIPKETIIQTGEIIISSGLDENIPRGLIIGEITRIENDANGFFQTAFVRPIKLYGTVNFVSVLTNRYVP